MSSQKKINNIISDTFLQMATALETGEFGKKPVIGIAADESEHGMEEIYLGAELARARGCEVIVIEADCVHTKMEQMLASGEIDGAVTMHYPFPIGVATIGKVVTPGKGRSVYIASTTGTADTDRVAAMVKNTIYGIIAAKASGIAEPTVGIVNIDGARQTEKVLNKLAENGYDIKFAGSQRSEGGAVMRGNDLIAGSADVMVMDSLTGNLMMKIFSAGSTGGVYEATGWGYGPGVGEGFGDIIMIISRASGAPVIAGAVEYATQLIKGGYDKVAAAEFEKAKKAKLNEILAEMKSDKAEAKKEAPQHDIPPKEIVTAQIAGIEVMDLEDAVSLLHSKGIYAESGMGCTGPIVMISEANEEKAFSILKENDYL